MVRQGPVVRLTLALGTALVLAAFGAGPDTSKPKLKAQAKPSPAPSASKGKSAPAPTAAPADQAKKTEVPIEYRPYKIRAWVVVDQDARLDSRGRAALVAAWRGMVRRFVGRPWELDVAEGYGPLEQARLDELEPKDILPHVERFDKLWMIQVEPARNGIDLAGREYDAATRTLGPTCRRSAPFPADSPRALFQLSTDLFEPTAEIGAMTGGDVMVTVRCGALPASTAEGQIVKPGSVFKCLRIFMRPDGKITSIELVKRTFISVKSLAGAEARCAIVSSLRDPFTRRTTRRLSYVALGVKPASIPTRFRYMLDDQDKTPVAGYSVTVRPVPTGSPKEVGMTDRQGRIVIAPGFADGLVIFRLLAANTEPIDEFPAMPGETVEERTIVVRTKPEAVALETALNALRDELLDLVAVRARIEKRLKSRAESEKWEDVEALLKEYRTLTPRQSFVDRLTKLKDDATKRQAETKKAILTKAAMALVNDTQALIDRYLDDEAFDAYARALAEYRGEIARDAKKKSLAKRAPAASPVTTAPQTAPAAQPRPAQAPRPAPAPAPPSRPSGGNAPVPF